MFSFWIRKRIFSIISFCIKPLIKFEIEFDESVSVQEIKENLTIYALPSNSIADLVALEHAIKNLGLPSPLSNIKDTRVKQFVSLVAPKYSQSKQKIIRPSGFNLKSIIEMQRREANILPTSFYWGKHPDKQKSLFKILFSQSWAATGPIKKFFKIIFHGRALVIKFHKPLNLSNLIDQGKNTAENTHLISRYLRALFRKSKQAKLGPDISHRRTLVRSLSNSPEVRSEIKALAKGNVKTEMKLKKKAFRYANEICSDLNYPIIRLIIRFFSWFWNTRYDGINLNNLEVIKEISNDSSIIYVPCHRSHIDYCALSYVLFNEGLMVPQIPAGNNMNIPIMGKILRSGGAVFMRRSFNNSLYSTVFFQHIRNLMRRGSSIEFFPEGGRSRSGLSLTAKPGLISMILRSYSGLTTEKVKVVPIYIGYEKILEGKSYTSELSGKAKKTESLLDPLKVLKDFNNYLGNVFINFGEPIDLGNFLSSRVKQEELSALLKDEKPTWFKEATTSLGEEIMQGINSSVAVTTTSLFATSLLTDSAQSLQEAELKTRIQMFLQLIQSSKTYKHVWLSNNDPGEIIDQTVKLQFVKEKLVGNSRIFNASESEIATLSYYKNNISHVFMMYSGICETLRYVEKISRSEMERLVRLVFPFFKRDFHLLENYEDLSDAFSESLNTLIEMEIIVQNDNGELSKPKQGSFKNEEFMALCNICEPSIKRFYITMFTLWNHPGIQRNALQERCVEIAKKLESVEGWPYPEFSDKSKFDQFIDKMLMEKFVKEGPNKELNTSRITQKARKDYSNFFNRQFLDLIEELN